MYRVVKYIWAMWLFIYIYISTQLHSLPFNQQYMYVYLYMRILYITYRPCNTSTNSRNLDFAYLLHCPYKAEAIWSLPGVRTKGKPCAWLQSEDQVDYHPHKRTFQMILDFLYSGLFHGILHIRNHLSMVIHHVSYVTFSRSSWQAPFFAKTLMTSEWFP